jgi:hypothetical protein
MQQLPATARRAFAKSVAPLAALAAPIARATTQVRSVRVLVVSCAARLVRPPRQAPLAARATPARAVAVSRVIVLRITARLVWSQQLFVTAMQQARPAAQPATPPRSRLVLARAAQQPVVAWVRPAAFLPQRPRRCTTTAALPAAVVSATRRPAPRSTCAQPAAARTNPVVSIPRPRLRAPR